MTFPNIVPEVKRLIDTYQARDYGQFQTVMEKLAVKIEKAGGDKVAAALRAEAVKRFQRGRIPQLHQLPKSKGFDVATVFTPIECEQKSKHLVLTEQNTCILSEFERIVAMKEAFEAQDVPLPNKIVMYGPPGTGKTLSAFHLAARLELPLLWVRLDTLIDSHLGETGTNVRKVFEFAKGTPCVLFLDEFDALGGARGTQNEVKEMSRVVNTLLQCLDDFDGDSVLIAATNLEAKLDAAVWRRFDTKMVYALPEPAERTRYIKELWNDAFAITLTRLEFLFAGHSFADIEQVIYKAKRKAILESAKLSYDLVKGAYDEYFPEKVKS